jgi:beta-glucosidase
MKDFLEKVKLLDGLDVWHTKPSQDCGSIMMADGPHGLRKQINDSDNLGLNGSLKATCFPAASLVACSWDPSVVMIMATSIAKEAKASQINIVLGPGINIKRSPVCGRNFEYFSEDPYLTGVMASSYIRAMEDNGVGCSVKHFCCNNQERYRFTEDSIVDARALNEIYLPAFKKCIQEKPASVMTSYNKLNGIYTTEHPYLHDILRHKWGYDGLVITDWAACNNRVQGVLNGCDLEMPSSGGYNIKKLIEASVNNEPLKIAINKSYNRIVKTVNKYKDPLPCTYDIDEHHKYARYIANQSIVLLKNEDNILPLNKETKVALIGGFVNKTRYQGGGSSYVNPHKLENLIDVYLEYSSNIEVSQGYSLDGNDNQRLLDQAVALAKKVERVVMLIGLPEEYESEGFDRENLNLPINQLKLLHEINKVNSNIIVVCLGGSVMNLSFETEVKGLIMAYLPGQANSHAIMDIVYGLVNPSGRLAETFIDKIEDCNVQLDDSNNAIYYDESIYVGYRYYNTFDKPVRYPFGYGLSYTEFTYSDLKIIKNDDKFEVSVKVKNVGPVKGKEVVQLYINNNYSSVYKAKRELKEFTKIELDIDEEKIVKFTLHKEAFQYYDIHLHKFIVNGGIYKIQICKNVNQVILDSEIQLESDHDFINHATSSYLSKTYDTCDFPKIYGSTLPPKMINYHRPYTLNNSLKDIKRTFLGKLVSKYIMKEATKLSNDMKEEWMKKVMVQTLQETPLRALAVMSNGVLSLEAAEGIIDLVNLKMIKGYKKIKRGLKK